MIYIYLEWVDMTSTSKFIIYNLKSWRHLCINLILGDILDKFILSKKKALIWWRVPVTNIEPVTNVYLENKLQKR